eukprot:INCI15856.1.p1 GENE.INCI15856.1~~INCI15856.1.p1  ORF type:complete len:406 (-),score=64.52 INCI15856.1:1501-2718(-)
MTQSYQSMRELELLRHHPLPANDFPTSSYLRLRVVVIKYMADIVRELRLCRGALHLAVSYLDRLADRDIPMHCVFALAVAALFVAVKFVERDDKIPCAHELCFQEAQAKRFCVADVLYMEKQLLRDLKWDMVDYVALDFLRYFLQKGCLFDDDILMDGADIENPGKAVKKMTNLCLLLVDSSLINIDLQHWRPSVLAAGIVYTARRILGLREVVRAEIDDMFGASRSRIPVFACMPPLPAHFFRSGTMSRTPNPNHRRIEPSCRLQVVVAVGAAVNNNPAALRLFCTCCLADLDETEVAQCATVLWDKFKHHKEVIDFSPRGVEELVHAQSHAYVSAAEEDSEPAHTGRDSATPHIFSSGSRRGAVVDLTAEICSAASPESPRSDEANSASRSASATDSPITCWT